MIERHAVVTSIDGQHVSLVVEERQGCGSCSQRAGCSELQQYQPPPGSKTLSAISPFPLMVGDRVVITIDQRALIKASIVCYLLPLLALIAGGLAGAALAEKLGWGELLTLFSAITLFGASFVLVNRIIGRLTLVPTILRSA